MTNIAVKTNTAVRRTSETDLVNPALRIIFDNPGIRTAELIRRLEQEVKPSIADLEVANFRTDSKFSQIVRNLVSHRTLEVRLGFERLIEDGDKDGAAHFITAEGATHLMKALVSQAVEILEYVKGMYSE